MAKTGPKPGPDRVQHEILIEAATKGRTNKDAASLAGVPERTFYDWLSNPNLAEFAAAYANARAKGRALLVDHIIDAAPADWRAAAWLLERMDPAYWGKAETDGTGLAKVLADARAEHTDAPANQ